MMLTWGEGGGQGVKKKVDSKKLQLVIYLKIKRFSRKRLRKEKEKGKFK